MTDWRDATLAELCESVDYGYTASASDDPELPRFLRITDIAGDRLDWRTVPGCVIDARKKGRFSLRRGDIVVARTGATVGHAKLIPPDHPEAVFASYLVRFRPKAEVNAAFLGAIAESQAYKDWVLANAGGAAQPNANAKTLGSFPLRVPDERTQSAIGQIFSSISDLIENNRQRIEILEEMAQVSYREWFVRFHYPGHEIDPLVDSRIGCVPRGWKILPLDDLASIGRDTVDAQDVPADYPAVGLEHIPRRQITLGEWGSAAELQSRKTRFRASDVLFGKIRPYFHKVSVAPLDGICSTDAIVIRPRDPFWGLVVMTVSSTEFVGHATQTASGTKMPRADWKVIGQYPVAVPPEELAGQFTVLIRMHLDTAKTLMFMARKLTAIRDLLLPRLVTGQIDVTSLDLDAVMEASA